jgi:signal transduction histidine kinase
MMRSSPRRTTLIDSLRRTHASTRSRGDRFHKEADGPPPALSENVVSEPARVGASQEQMRQLAARIQRAREDERAVLARELHDELGQTLTAIKLELGRAVDAVRTARMAPQAADRLQSLVGLIEIGIATVRRITTNLRPPALDHLGLPEAIRWEARMFRARTGLRCHVRSAPRRTMLSREQQTVLFRIFQEALTNVVRHARASAVHVGMFERPGMFELRIRDNGRGITESEIADPRSIGLLGMQERAALAGGIFDVRGRRGQGTTITVRVRVDGDSGPVSSGKAARARPKR